MGLPTGMDRVDLDRFFRPSSVAVIGASDAERRPNTAMWRKLKGWAQHFGADLYPVNPNREQVDGVPCFPSIRDVPVAVDVAAIVVGDPISVLPDVIAAGARFGVIFAAGFAEVGVDGEAAQEKLRALVADSSLRMLGPNTNLNAFEIFDDLPGQAITLITQSGHQGRPLFQSQELGLRFSHWAPTGNEVDLEFADFVRYFVDLEDTGAVAAYVEGFSDGRKLMLAADHALQRGVPITVVKVGRTAEGRSMALSHTGHLTGSDDVVGAVLRQYGITRVDGLDELQDVAMTFARSKPPTADGVCIYAISGGTGAHMADMAAAAGLHLPDLSEDTQARLRALIPDYLRVSNPVDSGGALSAHPEGGSEVIDAIVLDPAIGAVIVPITGAVASISEGFARNLVAASQRTKKPLLVVWGSPTGDEESYRKILLDSQLPVFRTFANCVRACRAYFDYYEFLDRYRSPFFEVPRGKLGAASDVEPLLTGAGTLSEHDAKRVLQAYGIPVTDDKLVHSRDAAIGAAASISGPVVLKICSPDLLHKTDHGLVKVGLDSAESVGDAYDEIANSAARVDPSAVIEGVLVAPMAFGGVECVLGVVQDELFGPTIMFGLGGVSIEVFKDVTFRVPPFTRDEARRMVQDVRGYVLLEGSRGQQPADIDRLLDAIMNLQTLAMDFHDRISELDINPLLVTDDGVLALDALVVTSP